MILSPRLGLGFDLGLGLELGLGGAIFLGGNYPRTVLKKQTFASILLSLCSEKLVKIHMKTCSAGASLIL